MEALKPGSVLLPSARNEIIDALATIILLETTHHTSNQLQKIAIRLVSVYPNIGDKVPGGPNYVSQIPIYLYCFCDFKASWKRKLQNKFKNLHRTDRFKTAGLTPEPPQKRAKMDNDTSQSTIAEYKRHASKLKEIYKSKKGVLSGMRDLLSETYG